MKAGPVAAAVIAVLAFVSAALGSPASASPTLPALTTPTYVSLIFSRSEVATSDGTRGTGCTPNDNSHVAGLLTTVEPWLTSMGITATGSLVTSTVAATTRTCTHYGRSEMASWADVSALTTKGWSFISHTATYPRHLSSLTPAQSYAETCGSAHTLDAHGVKGGHGMINYPGAQNPPVALQTKYGQKCFAFGRVYGGMGTQNAANTIAPYWGHVGAPSGGACPTISAPCHSVVGPEGATKYTPVGRIKAKIAALQPGEWFAWQNYILVKGTSPAGSIAQWDCTSADPNLHWTNDVERYCYVDFQAVVRALAAKPGVVFTDPLTVGIAFGRPATYP